jgi:hypothetical protein
LEQRPSSRLGNREKPGALIPINDAPGDSV